MMKLSFAWTLLLVSAVSALHGQHVSKDSIMTLLKTGKAHEVKTIITSGQFVDPASSASLMKATEEYFMGLACFALGDSLAGLERFELSRSTQLQTDDREKFLTLVFYSGNLFITKKDVYQRIQDFGYSVSTQYQDARSQFSFLQQMFSMYQMTHRIDKMPPILKEMKKLGSQHPYLDYMQHIQFGFYYSGLNHDSAVYHFEKSIEQSTAFVGKPNPHFLLDKEYTVRRDSSVMAGAMMEYARYMLQKGDLKKAGELFVYSKKLIPDTSAFVVIRIQNLLHLSTVYADLVNPSLAVQYVEDAVLLCEENKLHRMRQTKVASAYAYALLSAGHLSNAAAELELAYQQYPRGLNCQDPARQSILRSLVAAYQEDWEACRRWRDTTMRLGCTDDHELQFHKEMVDGLLSQQSKRFDMASQHFIAAGKIAAHAKKIGWKKQALHLHFKCEKENGNLLASIDLLEKLSALNDSLYRTGQDVALFDIEASYQKTIQDETIARLAAQKEIQSASLVAQKKQFIFLMIAFLVVTILFVWALRMYGQLKKSNQIISRAIEEKNILLREIHHRVKNNLQVISSLLKLQTGYIKDDAAIQAMAEGRSRVQSMALLHQNLYREDNLTGVDMREYFENLIQGLFDTYNISADRIRLHKNIDSISLDVDTVVPLGLITNELISNALKHAFPDMASGDLFVDLKEKDNMLILQVRDNGTGMTVLNKKDGFGSKLIQSLSDKLDAEIKIESGNGTLIEIAIRDYKKAA